IYIYFYAQIFSTTRCLQSRVIRFGWQLLSLSMNFLYSMLKRGCSHDSCTRRFVEEVLVVLP
ncbi:hypothetical protein BC629DRAFT_1570081, partial [Irpex lacteus]